MHINHRITMQLASERIHALRAEAPPRRTRRGFRLALRRLRIHKRQPAAVPTVRVER